MDTQHNDGGPAFPHNNWIERGSQRSRQFTDGMSLRDWFAGQADIPWDTVCELLAIEGNDSPTVKQIIDARVALKLMEADAMLAARKEKQ